MARSLAGLLVVLWVRRVSLPPASLRRAFAPLRPCSCAARALARRLAGWRLGPRTRHNDFGRCAAAGPLRLFGGCAGVRIWPRLHHPLLVFIAALTGAAVQARAPVDMCAWM
jgi:hypothetical protein